MRGYPWHLKIINVSHTHDRYTAVKLHVYNINSHDPHSLHQRLKLLTCQQCYCVHNTMRCAKVQCDTPKENVKILIIQNSVYENYLLLCTQGHSKWFSW